MEAYFGPSWGGGGGGWLPLVELRSNPEPLILNLCTRLWWKFMTGSTVVLPWPPDQPISGGISSTNDPNDLWRPELEADVGRQHIDWDWHTSGNNTVTIRFRRGKNNFATQCKLRWG